jgi:uncharacterized repeat protein (TIGR03803 family)
MVLLVVLTAVLTAASASAQTFAQLYDFKGGADGANPVSGLTLGSDGSLYGTTETGGSGPCIDTFHNGCGVVFKLSKSGRFTTIYQFQGGTDGAAPDAGVILDSHGNVFGTTFAGGGGDCKFALAGGCGTIFKIDASGKETVLYRFGGGLDGGGPHGTLNQDAGGNLWGTTELGGIFTNRQCSSAGCGTLFRLDRNGNLLSRAFQGPPNDGATPLAGLVADPNGTFYGTAYQGGTNSSGILFKVSPTRKLTVLHYFNGAAGDASNPTGLIISGGKIYGSAVSGGADQGGAVYEVDLSGEHLLYSFGEGNDESVVFAQGLLARESDGTLYGTTTLGFLEEDNGKLYKLDAAGNFEVVHQFFGQPDGSEPDAGVIRDAAGNIYGTTELGGASNAGTIFKFTP